MDPVIKVFQGTMRLSIDVAASDSENMTSN